MMDRRTFFATMLAGAAVASVALGTKAEAMSALPVDDATQAPVEMQGASDAAQEPRTPPARQRRGRGWRHRSRNDMHRRWRHRRMRHNNGM